MTLSNYVKFLQMNLKGLRSENSTFFSEKIIKYLHSSTMHDNYVLVWGISQIDGVPISTHAGSDGSFYALVGLQPRCDVGVVVVLNSAGEAKSKGSRRNVEHLAEKVCGIS